MIDHVSSEDFVQAVLDLACQPPQYPCPKCGKESKEAQQEGYRVCSNSACRTEFKP